jgi:hypothetical protein
VQRIDAVTERVERLRGGVELVQRPCQIARGERDLGLGDLAAGLGEAFVSAEAARGASQELACPLVVAEHKRVLSHSSIFMFKVPFTRSNEIRDRCGSAAAVRAGGEDDTGDAA